jgi:hypothetical protein
MREETKVFCSFIKPMLIEEILRKHFIPESAIQEMHLRVALLKAAISHNLNLTKIRSLFREARESKSDSAPSGNSPLLEIATKTVESLGIAKEAIPAEEEGKAALFTSFLEEFTRQANLYLESP